MLSVLFLRICIALYKLASCCEYRTVASMFGVGKTTVHRYVYMFSKALCRKKNEYIEWYSSEEAKTIAQLSQRKYKYPQAIGAIDGSHIPINAPLDGKADYLCRKGYPSIVLQAVVDTHIKFRDVYANTAGAAHDATVFYRSPLSKLIATNMPQGDITINDTVIPLHILGDPAYPLSAKIMKGFVGTNLNPADDSFNVYLSSARMCVEIAFGRLKSRWRMLQKRMDLETKASPRIITACCILHNMCEDLKVPLPATNQLEEANAMLYPQPAAEHYDRVDERHAYQMRAAIRHFLAETEPLRKSFHR